MVKKPGNRARFLAKKKRPFNKFSSSKALQAKKRLKDLGVKSPEKKLP